MARELYRCTLCDHKVEKSGRYGHVKFTDGNGHGPKGEVVENADNLFVEYDEEIEQEMDEAGNENKPEDGTNTPESTDTTEGRETGNENATKKDSTNQSSERDTDTERKSALRRFKEFLFTDVSDL